MTEEDALEIDTADDDQVAEDLSDTYRRLRHIAHQQLRRYLFSPC